jgi:GTP-binding protein EngB required for normal cell division
MDLQGYEKTKFALAELLRSADALDPRDPQGRHANGDLVRDLFSRLAEDRFNLVVVGRFSRGKTSLMNAILGSDRLPTGIRPLTSVITTVTYGSEEKAVIHYRHLGLPEEIPLARLPQYITESGNSGNHRGIAIAQVQLPAELLRRGFHFIDTPGLGSPILENTRTTERFLPQADAFVLVTSYEGPLSEEELRFLGEAVRSGRRVFVVVNKADTVSAAERAETLAYLREQLVAATGLAGSAIFSLSARNGLAAKQAHDHRLLQESGVAAFEEALLRFLIDEKAREFLLRMCERVAGLLRVLPPGPEIARLGDRLTTLARGVDAGRASARSNPAIPAMPVAQANVDPMRPCAICVDVARKSYDFLCRYQYDIVVNTERQRELAERNGLCAFHIWGYESIASPLGTCAGFAAVLDRLAERLVSAAASRTSLSAPSNGVVAEPSCIVCDARAAAETAAVKAVALRLRQSPDDVLRSLGDLCIPHFRLLAGAIADPQIAARLFGREATLLQRVAEDMRRYALKQEGLRRDLASDEEMQAGHRALSLLGGHRSLNTPIPGGSRCAP